MLEFKVESHLGVWTDIFTAEATIKGDKMSLTYFYQSITYPFGGSPKLPIKDYQDAPLATDKLIEQARQFCNRNNLTLWSY